MKRLLLLLVVFCLLASTTALADLKQGDAGDGVAYLQGLLQDTGWLFAEPDGKFGPKTEKALMNYQRAKGLPPTGVADGATMEQLSGDWYAMMYVQYGEAFFIDGAGADGRGQESYCYTSITPEHGASTTYCSHHAQLVREAEALMLVDDAAGAAQLYEQDIIAMYKAWISMTDNPDMIDAIKSAMGSFTHAADMQTAAYSLWVGPLATQAPAMNRAAMLRNHMAFLCEIVNMENQGGEN